MPSATGPMRSIDREQIETQTGDVTGRSFVDEVAGADGPDEEKRPDGDVEIERRVIER